MSHVGMTHALFLLFHLTTKFQTSVAYNRRGMGATTRIIPNNVIVEIFDPSTPEEPLQSIYTSGSAFGPLVPFGREEAISGDVDKDTGADAITGIVGSIGLPIYHTPAENRLLCNDVSENDAKLSSEPFVLLIPRGLCTFEQKVLNAQKIGAHSAMIYNNLSSRYELDPLPPSRLPLPSASPSVSPTHIANGTSAAGAPSSYSLDYLKKHMNWPKDEYDYECSNGKALIPLDSFSFIPSSLSRGDNDNRLIYDGTVNDALLTGLTEDNLCLQYEVPVLTVSEEGAHDKREKNVFKSSCVSKRCLLTGHTIKQEIVGMEVPMIQGCCAWDISFNQIPDNDDKTNALDIQIPSVFLTMEQGDNLLVAMMKDRVQTNGTDSERQVLTAIMYERPYPNFNLSSLFLCLLGTWATWIASWRSAKVYRDARKDLETIDIDLGPMEAVAGALPIENITTNRNHSYGDAGNSTNANTLMGADMDGGDLELMEVTIEDNEAERNVLHANENGQSERDSNTGMITSTAGNTNVVQNFTSANVHRQDIFELRGLHALTFVVIAASLLFLLFFTRIYGFVTVLYAIGGTTSIALVMIEPALNSVASRSCPKCIAWYGANRRSGRQYRISLTKGLSYMCSYGIGVVWIWYYYSYERAFLRPFYWIIQDIMGICVCVVFFDFVRLNNIQVATFFLLAFFLYDIFFVFATYFIFHKSIMETVVIGGGAIEDHLRCVKYPDHHDCFVRSPLPMLLAIPSIGDYIPGLSMLGLGDIILPGLLISFAARLDAAKKLVNTASIRTRAAGEGVRDVSRLYRKRRLWKRIFSGYFYRATLAYATGLMFALIVSHLTQHAQPALMYLIPLTVVTIALTGRRKHELDMLWRGHKALDMADEIVREISHVGAARFGVNPMDDLSIFTASSHTLSEDEHEVM